MFWLALFVFVAFLLFRKRQGTKATMRSGQTQTLANASDVRFHREPRGFRGRRGGLK